MIEFIFVLVVSTSPTVDKWEYQGNFESCEIAHLWMALHIDMRFGTIKHGN